MLGIFRYIRLLYFSFLFSVFVLFYVKIICDYKKVLKLQKTLFVLTSQKQFLNSTNVYEFENMFATPKKKI